MSVLSLIPEDKRKDYDSSRKDHLQSVYSSSSRLSLLQKRKKLNRSIEMSSNQSLNSRGDRYVTQRVLSAKTHRVKQLQNQLSDAHYHLQEISNENRVLKAMQKKYEIALARYEGSNAELPQVLNSHSEEMRVQLAKYKQLKQQYKESTMRLKERDLQLQQLKDEHQHLLELSKDRNLPEREKLQAQVEELTEKLQLQNQNVNMLQRKLILEAKNFKHQLQMEINKHKDTRQDLDLAISNADKLSTIIEMKEKISCSNSIRKSPRKQTSSNAVANVGAGAGSGGNIVQQHRPYSRTLRSNTSYDNRSNGESSMIARLAENSRNVTSALSQDGETSSSSETRFRSYSRSRTNSTTRTTPSLTRKNSKETDDMVELAKTVQDGMADLSIFKEEIDFNNTSPDEVQKKIDTMKTDLLNKIKSNEEPAPRLTSALRRYSTEESIEEIEEIQPRPRSRGLRSGGNVSFYGDVKVEETTTAMTINNHGSGDEIDFKLKRGNSTLERKLSGKPIDKYCKDIMQNIDKSSKVIDRHLKEFNTSKFESDQLVEQLQAVDVINNIVSQKGEIPNEAFEELNNNFKVLTSNVAESIPVIRKRSSASRKSSIASSESRGNLFGDSSMSNQDLLNDLLGKN